VLTSKEVAEYSTVAAKEMQAYKEHVAKMQGKSGKKRELKRQRKAAERMQVDQTRT